MTVTPTTATDPNTTHTWPIWLGAGLLVLSWHLAVVTVFGNKLEQINPSLQAAVGYIFKNGTTSDGPLPDVAPVLWVTGAYLALFITVWIVAASFYRRVRIGSTHTGLSNAPDLNAALTRAFKKARRPYAYIGRRGIYDTDEDSALILAPSGMGKTVRAVVGYIFRAGRAPLINTSTKPDVLRLTAWLRRVFGKVHVFDPEGVSRWPNPIKWDIVAGCADDETAMRRARALVAARPLEGDSSNSGFFANASETILRCMLHAAALENKSMRDVLAWTRDFKDDEPFAILRDHPDANTGWYDDLMKYSRGESPETASNVEQTLSGVLQAFSIRAILDSVCPNPGEGFSSSTFHASTDTLYLLTQSGGNALAAPVITTLVESIQQEATRAATRTREGRLSPVLHNILDEVPNICPIPMLPTLMSDGRGHGIKTVVVAQNRDQLTHRFGEHGTNEIVNNASVFLQLGGSRDTKHLQEMVALAGRRWTDQVSYSASDRGGSTNTATTKDDVLTVSDIAQLRVGQALLNYRNHAPAIVRLPAWFESKDKKVFLDSEQHVLELEGFTAEDQA
ncbi:type IV secretory system conjugative DNA transfer family protein [Subtercola vilae]|uniref:TraD/TraG TraM recognition site domain-containing protein n=1 Tax=Subtercola vilae TaxID=2056433 RepID=A0A4T2BW05_9MICO|nr:TraM recognition domain-containing protein [Subtercola vilae]TIH33778.1 hypothetical protein D4765_13930 [Subtercola vilae]